MGNPIRRRAAITAFGLMAAGRPFSSPALAQTGDRPGGGLDGLLGPPDQRPGARAARGRPAVSEARQEVRTGRAVDPRAYGAVGDGSSHKANTRYASLAALRADFGFAVSLDQEMDYLAVQKAINVAAVTVTGSGVVELASGYYMMNNASFPLAELVVPPIANTNATERNPAVIIRGNGTLNTTLHWPADMGAGKAGIRHRDLSGGENGVFMRSELHHLRVLGPSITAIGTMGNSMQGVRMSSQWRMYHCTVGGWGYGVWMERDHSEIHNADFTWNAYHIWFPDRATENHTIGNHRFNYVGLTAARRASIGIGGRGTMDMCVFQSCHMGFGPLAFWRERHAAAVAGGVTNSTFIDTYFEAHGNGIFRGNNDRHDLFTGNTLINCQATHDITDYVWASLPLTHVWALGRFANNTFIGCDLAVGANGGDCYDRFANYIHASDYAAGNKFVRITERDLDAPAGKSFLWTYTPGHNSYETGTEYGTFWFSNGAFAKGDVLAVDPSEQWRTVRASPAAKSLIGVGRQDTARWDRVPVAERGQVAVNKVPGAGTAITRGDPVCPSTDGTGRAVKWTAGHGMPLLGVAANNAADTALSVDVYIRPESVPR